MPSPEDRADGGIAERLEFEPVERRQSSRKWGRLVAFLVLVGVLSGGVWILWGKSFMANRDQADVPIIRADVTPIKVRPADPGGMDVPDRDKLVYGAINGEGAGSEVESLLPPPEEPLPLPEQPEIVAAPEPAPEPILPTQTEPAEEGAPLSLEPLALEATAPAIETPPPPPPAEETETSALDTGSEPPSKPEPIAAAPSQPEPAAVAPEPEPAPAPQPEPEPAPAPAATATQDTANLASRLPTADTYRIQLAALRSQDRAEAEWKRLRNAHTDLLGRLGLSIVRVDLGGDKGIFYRLRAGPLATADAAKTLCSELSSRNVGCLVVRPGS